MQRLKYINYRGREDKLSELASIFSNYLAGDVLDVGCDAKYLSSSVQGRYVGVDIAGTPDVQVNVETGLPFHNQSFDTVVAFDVMEHCDHIYFVFDELCRISRSYIIIGLPNMYEWRFRSMFLLGKQLSGKYGLPVDPPTDRHRWLFGLEEARDFVKQRALKAGFSVVEEAFGYYSYRRPLPRLVTMFGKLLAPRWAGIFVYQYWALLGRKPVEVTKPCAHSVSCS